MGRLRPKREISMTLLASGELYGYWNALRGERAAPDRGEIDPGALGALLADTFLLEFDEQNVFRFRIAGSRTNALFARELRGRSFLEIWRESDREQVKSVLQRAAGRAEPLLLVAEAWLSASTSLEVEATVLPLRQGNSLSRLLGSIAADEWPGELGLIDAGPLSLISIDKLSSGAMHRGAVLASVG